MPMNTEQAIQNIKDYGIENDLQQQVEEVFIKHFTSPEFQEYNEPTKEAHIFNYQRLMDLLRAVSK